MKIIINQPRASYFVGGGELISFDHAENLLKLDNEVTFITISPHSVGLSYSKQFIKFKKEYENKINIVELEQDLSIIDIYKIKPGEDRCRWNIESIFYNQKLYDFLVMGNKCYDAILSYYNLDSVFLPKKLVKKNVLYLCGFPKNQDDYQGSFLFVYDKVFAISEETQQYWQKYRKDKIKVFSTGVDYDRFYLSNRKNKSDGEIKVLFVGRLISRKNIDKIILAIEKLKHKYDIILTIVGDGPERDYLESLSHDTVFKGTISNPEYEYRNADIFVTPSQYGEGVQGTILEAMSSGLTIVATNSLINKELLGNGRGILIEPTVEDIEKGIEIAIKLIELRYLKK